MTDPADMSPDALRAQVARLQTENQTLKVREQKISLLLARTVGALAGMDERAQSMLKEIEEISVRWPPTAP